MAPASIVAITAAKNEGRYIEEWIRFHNVIGIRNFLIFDNDSTDDTGEILGRLSANINITLIKWPTIEGKSPQATAFNAGVSLCKGVYEFGLFIDVDEFLVPMNDVDFATWLNSIPTDVSAIALCQRVFGSSGHLSYEDRPIVERFTLSSRPDHSENLWYKSIYRLADVGVISNPHAAALDRGRYAYPDFTTLEETSVASGKSERFEGSVFQLHHYILKSREEFNDKKRRGGGMGSTLALRLARYENDKFFSARELLLNAVENTVALRVLERDPAYRSPAPPDDPSV